jgi:hypothetical protein
MTLARSPRPGRGPVDLTVDDRSDLSAGSLRFGHGVKFLSACIIAAVALSACSKKGETTAPESRADGESAAAPDDIDSLERELDLREQQLAALRGKPSDGGGLAGGGGQGVGRDANASARSELEKKRSAGDAGADMAEAQSGPTPTSAAPAPEPPMRDAPQDRCTTVCELSSAICGLQDRICELAPRHPGEPRYQAACQRAARDCEASQEACHACP